MADYESLKAEVESFVKRQDEALHEFHKEMDAKITEAKGDELLKALRDVNTRLDKIEKRLPPEVDVALEAGPRTR